VSIVQVIQNPWYGTGAWLVGITLGLLWLAYVVGKIRRRRK
jgi:hypothetical protein